MEMHFGRLSALHHVDHWRFFEVSECEGISIPQKRTFDMDR